MSKNPITPDKYDAVLFDLDGVITDTAKMHATCWKKMFDEYLRKRSNKVGEPFKAFEIAWCYFRRRPTRFGPQISGGQFKIEIPPIA